jgi:hypothetical protein
MLVEGREERGREEKGRPTPIPGIKSNERYKAYSAKSTPSAPSIPSGTVMSQIHNISKKSPRREAECFIKLIPRTIFRRPSRIALVDCYPSLLKM